VGKRKCKTPEKSVAVAATLLSALTAAGCYQSFPELPDGDRDIHALPDDTSSHRPDDGVPPDVGPDGDFDGGTDADADVTPESETAADRDGDVDAVVDAGRDTDIDSDASRCAGGWYDSSTGLCWEDPPDPWLDGWSGAVDYCEGLSAGGRDDWHLPTIGALRSLIRGCLGTVTGGACGVTDTCHRSECFNAACRECEYMFGDGPGTYGAFWPSELGGPPLDRSHWSSSDDYVAGIAWHVDFWTAQVLSSAEDYAGRVRCVRRGP
jgi:hypothetical protein